MTTFVHRALPLWTVLAAGQPKPYAASTIFYPDDGIVEIAVPRDGGVPHSVQLSRGLLIDGLAEPVEEAGVYIAARPELRTGGPLNRSMAGRGVTDRALAGRPRASRACGPRRPPAGLANARTRYVTRTPP